MLWDVFQACDVRLATSFYTARPKIHEEITRGRYSFNKTTENIKHAIKMGLPLRAGLIEMRTDQAIEEAELFLQDLGVQHIKIDRVRSVGRGETYIQVDDPRQALCGQCSRGKACITPNGDVYPCVFSRWLLQGNVLEQSFDAIITGTKIMATRADLTTFFLQRSRVSQKDIRTILSILSTEEYLKTQNVSHVTRPCDPDEEECNPDVPACRPDSTCLPDYMEPCNPAKPCSPMDSPCTPDMLCTPDIPCTPDKEPDKE